MNFTLLELFSLLCVIIPSSCQQQQCSRAGLKRFDEITSKATTFGNINLKFPEDHDGLQAWCKNSNKHLNDVEVYNKKCNTNLFKQIYGIFIYSYRNTLKQHCRANSKIAQKFLESTPCYNKNRQAEVSCYTTWVDSILGSQNAEEKKKIPHLCCSYLAYLECTKNRITNLATCDDSKVETMNNFVRSYLDNVLNFLCGDHNGENDKCVHLGESPKKKKSQRRTKTVAMPVADLLLSFPEI